MSRSGPERPRHGRRGDPVITRSLLFARASAALVPPGLAVVTGALLAWSLPPYNQSWLAWFGAAPLLFAARGRRPLEAVGLGLVSGVACGAVYGYVSTPFLLLAALLAMVALASNLYRRRSAGLAWVALVSAAAVAAEWATTAAPMPVHLALTQWQRAGLIQIAAVTGIWGVSFVLWWANSAIADVALERGAARPLSWATFGIAALLFLVGNLMAVAHNNRHKSARGSREMLRVAAIQDYMGDWPFAPAAAHPDAELPDQETLTRQAAKQGAKLIVWSELSLGAAFSPEGRVDPTVRLAKELKTHLVVGYLEPGRPKNYNCAAIVAPDGRVRGVHRKLHLFLGERNSTQPGRTVTAHDTDLGRIGMEICFDSCFTGVTRDLVRSGARLIAMPNFDPPSDGAVLHHLHGTMLPFRAVENGVPIVRADSSGLSQIVWPSGKIGAQAPMWSAEALVQDGPPGISGGTLFTRFGDWFAYACLLVIALGFLTHSSRGGQR